HQPSGCRRGRAGRARHPAGAEHVRDRRRGRCAGVPVRHRHRPRQRPAADPLPARRCAADRGPGAGVRRDARRFDPPRPQRLALLVDRPRLLSGAVPRSALETLMARLVLTDHATRLEDWSRSGADLLGLRADLA
ncbi:MAG: hypothetical protein ACK56I_14065, partial [bacterium]